MADVVTAPDPSTVKGPKVNFARFQDGSLKIFSAHTTELGYYAISHVWGKTEWLTMPGIDGEKLVSREKADFIQHELPSLVGDTAFWMDTLTVNQRNPTEVIQTVQAIPAIFRDAILTIAVREADGFYNCCMDVAKGCAGWDDVAKVVMEHATRAHTNDMAHESYLRRLWTLQECLLSRKIRFVPPKNSVPQAEKEEGWPMKFDYQTKWEVILDSMFTLAAVFCCGAEDIDLQIDRFLMAYLTGGTVSKPDVSTLVRSHADDIHMGNFYNANITSNRAAKYPRDYIFATMPQFPWYHYPLEAENMSFSEIFRDFYDKASNSGHAFVTRFVRSMTDSAAAADPSCGWQPSKTLPEPTCLGDFLKLMSQRTTHPLSPTSPDIHLTNFVIVRELTFERYQPDAVFMAVEWLMDFNPRVWAESHTTGELSTYGANPNHEWKLEPSDAASCGWVHTGSESEVRSTEIGEKMYMHIGPGLEYDECEVPSSSVTNTILPDRSVNQVNLLQQARMILNLMWLALDERRDNKIAKSNWPFLHEKMILSWSAPVLRTVALLAAMVACRIPLSADKWINQHFVPVVIKYDKMKMPLLGLLARHARADDRTTARQMYSIGTHLPATAGFGTDLMLADKVRKTPIGLIPEFFNPNTEPDKLLEKHLILYNGLVKEKPDKQTETTILQLDLIPVRSGDDSEN